MENRVGFGPLLDTHGYKTAVEIGVDYGRFAVQLLQHSKYANLWCVDPWAPYREILHDRSEAEQAARSVLSEFGNRVTILKTHSINAPTLIPKPIDFVYIDGAHDYENVTLDLKTWWRVVRFGGMVAGHDFDCSPVQQALYRFFRDEELYVVDEIPCGITGKHPSWYVYKSEPNSNITNRVANHTRKTLPPVKYRKLRD